MYEIHADGHGLVDRTPDLKVARMLMQRWASGPRNPMALSHWAWVLDASGKKVMELDRRHEQDDQNETT